MNNAYDLVMKTLERLGFLNPDAELINSAGKLLFGDTWVKYDPCDRHRE